MMGQFAQDWRDSLTRIGGRTPQGYMITRRSLAAAGRNIPSFLNWSLTNYSLIELRSLYVLDKKTGITSVIYDDCSIPCVR